MQKFAEIQDREQLFFVSARDELHTHLITADKETSAGK